MDRRGWTVCAIVAGALVVAVIVVAAAYAMTGGRQTAPSQRLAAAAAAATTNVDCSVSWKLSAPCSGDCWAAYEFFDGTVVVPPAGNGAPCPPLHMSVSCAGSMPCLCKGADLPITPAQSLTTCNDCTYLAPGETCFLACADPSTQVMMGVPELTCANGTWAFGGLPPSCNAAVATCPPVMNLGSGCTANGIIVQPGATCVDAGPGDTCAISCAAGFALPRGGVASATCINGSWTAADGTPTTLQCARQSACVGGGSGADTDTCAGTAGCPSVATGRWGAPPRGALL